MRGMRNRNLQGGSECSQWLGVRPVLAQTIAIGCAINTSVSSWDRGTATGLLHVAMEMFR